MSELFDAATKAVASLAASGALSDGELLQFYGLYKQATDGSCPSTGRPGILQFRARKKWDSWAQWREIPPDEAAARYVALLSELRPHWQAEEAPKRSSGAGGAVFSRLADVQAEDVEDLQALEEGFTPLHAAASRGDAAAVQQLVASGCDPNVQDSQGCTPLHWAADKGHADTIQTLLAVGATLDAVDEDGLSPLHYACVSEQRQAAECLAAAGADQSLRSNEGQTPASLARRSWDFWQGQQDVD